MEYVSNENISSTADRRATNRAIQCRIWVRPGLQRYSRQDRSCSVSGPSHLIGTCPKSAMCGRLRVGKDFLHAAGWSVQPCVRPVCAVHMTAGHNALRGSGPGQNRAFKDAMALMGCPDRRIDRLCITCCSPSQPSHHARVLGAISLDPQRGRIVVPRARGHHCPGHSRELVGKRDGHEFGRPSGQQRCEPGPMLGAVDLCVANDR